MYRVFKVSNSIKILNPLSSIDKAFEREIQYLFLRDKGKNTDTSLIIKLAFIFPYSDAAKI